MTRENITDSLNRRAYATESVVRWYRNLDVTYRVEEVILQRLHPFIKDKKLLDIGIGGGRTTRYLLDVSKDYTGVDYTPQLVQVAQAKYPQASIVCADARDLHLFDEDFDFVLFSLNGLDYIDHHDRLKAIREIYRVLKPGGFYMFSTHNRDYQWFKKLPWQEKASFTLGHLKSCLYTLAHWPRHLLMRKHEVSSTDYEIVNDSAHGFSLLTYYIRIDDQIKQLQAEGFEQIEAYDMDGARVQSDTVFPWIYYLARKPFAETGD
jgi:SAM-dependent methyltransferase